MPLLRTLSARRRPSTKEALSRAVAAAKPGAAISDAAKTLQTLQALELSTLGVRRTFSLQRLDQDAKLGLALAMDNAKDSGGRIVIYSIHQGSIAEQNKVPALTFLTAVNGYALDDGSGLDAARQLIASSLATRNVVEIEIAVPVGPGPAPAAADLIPQTLADPAPTPAKQAAAASSALVTTPAPDTPLLDELARHLGVTGNEQPTVETITEAFARIDANSDGVLTRIEVIQACPGTFLEPSWSLHGS